MLGLRRNNLDLLNTNFVGHGNNHLVIGFTEEDVQNIGLDLSLDCNVRLATVIPGSISLNPNILIFMTDQQQADVVRPGHPCITPHADALAQEGIRFTSTYCPTAHCCPSRATFMTGLYPSRHGIHNNVNTQTAINYGLHEGVETFSEHLKAAGYRMPFTGKWHVSAHESPGDRGWDVLDPPHRPGHHYPRDVDRWSQTTFSEELPPRTPGRVQRPGWGDFEVYRTLANVGQRAYEGLSDFQVTQRAVNWLLNEASRHESPWALWVGTIGPHDPFNVPAQYREMYDASQIDLPASYADTLQDKPAIYQRQRQQLWNQLTPEEVRESIAHYWAYCTIQDAMLGEVLAALEQTGQADDTLVVFLSDHGDYCGAHGLYLKGVPAFREAYHVPCIVRWPRGITNPGRTEDSLVSLADFAPTFLELADIETGQRHSGASLTSFFEDRKPANWREFLYTQLNGVELYYTQRAVFDRQHKYVFNGFDFDEFYDLERDPNEMTNFVNDPSYETIRRNLMGALWEFAAREDDHIFNPYGTVALMPYGPSIALGQ